MENSDVGAGAAVQGPAEWMADCWQTCRVGRITKTDFPVLYKMFANQIYNYAPVS